MIKIYFSCICIIPHTYSSALKKVKKIIILKKNLFIRKHY